MTIKPKFNIGDMVYLKTDPLQHVRLVLRIIIGPAGLEYTLGCGADASEHYEFEILNLPNANIVLGLDQDAINN